MNATPTTRGLHALRWAMGVGLVFVVVVGIALQVTQPRADERWVSMMSHWNEESFQLEVPVPGVPTFDLAPHSDSMLPGKEYTQIISSHSNDYFFETSGGNIFHSWRQGRGGRGPCTLVVRQERNLFGSSIEARLSGGTPEQVEAVTAIFAAADVELVVES